MELNESDEFILDTVRHCVWSGFYNFDEIQAVIDDIIEVDANETLVRSSVAKELAKKREEEKTWPEVTDCDRLDQAFEAMNLRGIIALQNTGQTMSDGLEDVAEALEECEEGGAYGYCFYHGQDLERALEGGGLFLAFGDLNNEEEASLTIAEAVKACLEVQGFVIEWDGDANSRLGIPEFDWKRRYAIANAA